MWLITEYRISEERCAGHDGKVILRTYLKLVLSIEELQSEIKVLLERYGKNIKKLNIAEIIKKRSITVDTCSNGCETYLWIDILDGYSQSLRLRLTDKYEGGYGYNNLTCKNSNNNSDDCDSSEDSNNSDNSDNSDDSNDGNDSKDDDCSNDSNDNKTKNNSNGSDCSDDSDNNSNND